MTDRQVMKSLIPNRKAKKISSPIIQEVINIIFINFLRQYKPTINK